MDARNILAKHYPFVAMGEDDGWAVYFPDLPGCQTFAETWEEIGDRAREAFELWVEVELDRGRTIPRPTAADDGLPWDQSHFAATPEPLMTSEEVADILNVTAARVRQLAVARNIGRKAGRVRLYSRSDVAAMQDRKPGRPARKETSAAD